MALSKLAAAVAADFARCALNSDFACDNPIKVE